MYLISWEPRFLCDPVIVSFLENLGVGFSLGVARCRFRPEGVCATGWVWGFLCHWILGAPVAQCVGVYAVPSPVILSVSECLELAHSGCHRSECKVSIPGLPQVQVETVILGMFEPLGVELPLDVLDLCAETVLKVFFRAQF